MEQYKQERHFNRCLSQLDLENVILAIQRAKMIMKRNNESGFLIHKYNGFEYYDENPSLSIWEIIEKILRDCQLM